MLIFFKKKDLFKKFLIIFLLIFNTGLNANIIRDAEIEKFLKDMANPIFEAANLNLNAVDIYIFNDDAVNAFVACGQKVFINTGTWTNMYQLDFGRSKENEMLTYAKIEVNESKRKTRGINSGLFVWKGINSRPFLEFS